MALDSSSAEGPKPAERHKGAFQNAGVRPPSSIGKTLGIFWRMIFQKPASTRPAGVIPVKPLTREQLDEAADFSVYRLGHSTLLLKLKGKYWLTDPVYAERASPFQWAGPKRFHAPPISLDELPPLEAVILSHNHYDHLDQKTVLQLAAKTQQFLAPLGVGDLLVKWGVPASKVQQLDWWQGTQLAGIRFIATPSQHFSGRGLFDHNQTLWASWVMIIDDVRIFFSGDSGYFDGFKEIGRRYGPFDMAFLETGAYDKRWEYVHMLPEQTTQAFRDLNAKWLFPIHNGTFDLAMHPWADPFEQITRLAGEQGIALTTPVMGEHLELLAPHTGSTWWRNLAGSTTGV